MGGGTDFCETVGALLSDFYGVSVSLKTFSSFYLILRFVQSNDAISLQSACQTSHMNTYKLSRAGVSLLLRTL